MTHIIYQAGPLFSEEEREWHQILTLKMQKAGHVVIWPGAILSPEAIRKAGRHAVQLISETCASNIERSTCVVALLDGSQADDSKSWEIGYAHAKGIPVYGIRLDSRGASDTKFPPLNSMIEGCLTGLAGSVDEFITMLEQEQSSL